MRFVAEPSAAQAPCTRAARPAGIACVFVAAVALGCASARPPAGAAGPTAGTMGPVAPTGSVSVAPPNGGIGGSAQSNAPPSRVAPNHDGLKTFGKVGMVIGGGLVFAALIPITYEYDACDGLRLFYSCYAKPEYPLRTAGFVQLGVGTGLLIVSGLIYWATSRPSPK